MGRGEGEVSGQGGLVIWTVLGQRGLGGSESVLFDACCMREWSGGISSM